MEEEKDYVCVWLPKSLAKSVKELENGVAKEKIIRKFFEESKESMQDEVDDLDDYVKSYVGLMATAKQALRKAKEEQLNASYVLWEKFDKEIPDIEEKVKVLVQRLNPLESKLDDINQSLNSLSVYKAEQAVNVIEKLNSMSSDTKKMFKVLLESEK